MFRTILAGAALAALAGAAQAADTAAQVKRGGYLVNGVAGCGDCHTPMGPNGPAGPLFSGAKLPFAPAVPMPWADRSPAIAGLPTGYTRAQFVTLMRTGQKPGGGMPRPPMPQYRMTAQDADAVAAYLVSLKR